MSNKITKEKVKQASKAYNRLDPGNTIITRKKFVERFLISRTVLSLITTILFIYAIYTAYNDTNTTGFMYWFWLIGYIGISCMYLYYTYAKSLDVLNYRRVKNNSYISGIEDNEHMFIYGEHVGRLSDFGSRREIEY